MKQGIHPEYHEQKVTCSCGEQFVTRSTGAKDLHLEVCSNCHPHYTGKKRIMDTAGRIEQYKNRYKRKREGS